MTADGVAGALARLRRWLSCCVCGHDQAAHAHYRAGRDCALCACPQYGARWGCWWDPREQPAGAEADDADRSEMGLLVTDPFVHLECNLSPDTAGELEGTRKRKGLGLNDAIRRAVLCWAFIEAAIARGGRIAVIEPDGRVVPVKVIR